MAPRRFGIPSVDFPNNLFPPYFSEEPIQPFISLDNQPPCTAANQQNKLRLPLPGVLMERRQNDARTPRMGAGKGEAPD